MHENKLIPLWVNLVTYIVFCVLAVAHRGWLIKKHSKADLLRFFTMAVSVIVFPLHPSLFFVTFMLGALVNDEWMRNVWHFTVIYFGGIDGSGKSRHAEATIHWLNTRYEGTRRACTIHFFRNPVLTALSQVKHRLLDWSTTDHPPIHTVQATSNPQTLHKMKGGLPQLRAYVCLLDNLLYILSRTVWERVRGHRILIADRYFYDYVLRLTLLGYPTRGLRHVYSRLFPRHGIIFDVDTQTAFHRRREHPLPYYERARREYLRIAEKHDYPVVNTEIPFEHVQILVNRYIEAYTPQ